MKHRILIIVPKAQIRVCRVIADAPLSELPVHILKDKTEDYNISGLLTFSIDYLHIPPQTLHFRHSVL